MKIGNQVSHLVRCSGIRLLLALGVSCLLLQSANAAILFSEAFDYTSGSTLAGSVNPSNSVAWSAANAGLSITNVNLTFSGLADQGGNGLRIANLTATTSVNTFANQTAGTVFYSFLFNPTAADSANNYVTAMNPGTTPPGGGSDAIDMYYYANGQLRLRANALSAQAGTGPVLTLGQTYFVVMGIDLTAKTASLWLDPTPGAAAPTPTVSLSGITATAVANVGFKSQTAAGGPYVVDNLLIGTTWGDVTPQAIPEPSTIALTAAGLGLMMAMIRRRRS